MTTEAQMRERVLKFPKNFCWETNGQLAELIKQAEECLPYIEENSIGYYYYWMLQVLKQQAALASLPRMTKREIYEIIAYQLHGDCSGLTDGVDDLVAKLPHIVKETV